MDRRPLPLALLCALLVFSACGDGGDRGAAGRAASPSPSATPTAAATSAASPSAPAASATAAAPVEPGADLARALLTTADLPPGFNLSGTASWREQDDTTRLCGVDRTYRALARTQAEFSRRPEEPLIGNVVTHFAPGDAQRSLDDTNEVLKTCSTWQEARQGSQGSQGGPVVETFRLAPLPAPALGEQSVAFRLDAFRSTGTLLIAIVLVRRGDLTSAVVYTARGAPPVNMDLLEQLARRADQRLATVAGRR